MDDTDRVVESEVCETVLLAGTDARRDDDDMVRNIRSMAIGATFICSRSTIILQIYKTTTRFKSNREKMQTLRIDRHDPGLFAILSVTFLEVPAHGHYPMPNEYQMALLQLIVICDTRQINSQGDHYSLITADALPYLLGGRRP